MRSIQNENDFAQVLSEQHSVIYFYVDWSVYAVQGRSIFEELELFVDRNLKISFWFADVSDLKAPAAFLAEWINAQEREDLKMSNVVTCGTGSVAWLKSGTIVDFVQSATHWDLQALRNRTETAFHQGTT
ncbi:MAG TPA: hypothetical protein VF074_19105 [Pyrinomonadaceae bacterium]